VLADLAPNAVTTVDVPATKAGSYTLTCGMGMMSGQLSVGAAGAKSASPLPWLLLALAGAGGALWIARKRGAIASAEAAGKAGNGGTASRNSKGTSRTPGSTSAPSAQGVLGFQPTEIVLIAAAVGLAVMAGLVIGGVFN